MAYTDITEYTGGIPQRGQAESTFTTNVNDWLAWVVNAVGEFNDAGDYVDTVAGQVASDAVTASNSATIASASANYQGEYNAGTSYSVGESVSYNDVFYYSKVDANVGNTPSSSPTQWQEITQSYDLSLDASPTLGGDLYSGGFNIIASGSGTVAVNGFKFKQGSYDQGADVTVTASGTLTFDYSNYDRIKATATGDFALAFNGFITGQLCYAVIEATNWGAWTPTYPAGLQFADSTAPTLTASGTDILVVEKDKDEVYTLFVSSLSVGTV